MYQSLGIRVGLFIISNLVAIFLHIHRHSIYGKILPEGTIRFLLPFSRDRTRGKGIRKKWLISVSESMVFSTACIRITWGEIF